MGTHVSSEGPVLAGGTVCVPTRAKKYTDRGTLAFLDPASGTTRWRHSLSANGNAITCPDGRTLYVLATPFPDPPEKTLGERKAPTLYALRRGDS